MQQDRTASAERRTLELSYVTEHLRDLQGMVGMPFTFGLLAYVAWEREHGFRTTQVWFLLAGLLAAFFMGKHIRRWYGESFGLVHEPEPEIVTSPVLSILHVKPAPTQEQKIAARKHLRFRRGQVWIGAIWMVLSVMSLTGRHPASSSYQLQFMIWSTYLLLPRCLWDAPQVFSLQLRRALSVGAMAGLIVLTIAASFALITKWSLLYFVLSGAVVLLSYDHWLLLHLLPAPTAHKEATGE